MEGVEAMAGESGIVVFAISLVLLEGVPTYLAFEF
jgi:hypothetical protein